MPKGKLSTAYKNKYSLLTWLLLSGRTSYLQRRYMLYKKHDNLSILPLCARGKDTYNDYILLDFYNLIQKKEYSAMKKIKINLGVINTIASVLTPIIVLVIGTIINSNIEITESYLSKEKDWQNQWADKFLVVANNFNLSVSEIVVGFHNLASLTEEQKQNSSDTKLKTKLSDEINHLNKYFKLIQKQQWDISIYADFAPKHGEKVSSIAVSIFTLLKNLRSQLKGNLEEIRDAQISLNREIRKVHAEILNLNTDD